MRHLLAGGGFQGAGIFRLGPVAALSGQQQQPAERRRDVCSQIRCNAGQSAP